jgi:hypothetical protein
MLTKYFASFDFCSNVQYYENKIHITITWKTNFQWNLMSKFKGNWIEEIEH